MSLKNLVKSIYKILPFKKQVFSLLKRVWKPGKNIYQHLYFKGVINVPVEPGISFRINHYGYMVENEIFWKGLTGSWEKESLKLWIKLCKNADTVFDIGANTGVYALMAKSINPSAKVYAFEPVERVFDKLKQNIKLNNYDIVPIAKAVSDKQGVATIYDTDTEHVYSVTVNKNLSDSHVPVKERKVNTISLDHFIRENNIKKLDLVKIDVETHEPEVLAGFSSYLKEFKPTILIEVLNPEVGAKVTEAVKGLGYLYFNIDEKGSVRKVDSITKSDYYNYLLCSPEVAHTIGLS